MRVVSGGPETQARVDDLVEISRICKVALEDPVEWCIQLLSRIEQTFRNVPSQMNMHNSCACACLIRVSCGKVTFRVRVTVGLALPSVPPTVYAPTAQGGTCVEGLTYWKEWC